MVLFAVFLYAVLCLIYFSEVSLLAFFTQSLILDRHGLPPFASEKSLPVVILPAMNLNPVQINTKIHIYCFYFPSAYSCICAYKMFYI